jgi:Integrase core domain
MSSRSPEDRYRPETDSCSRGFTPPAWRNQRNPTGEDTPASVAASSVIAPAAIAAQNLTLSSRQATVGRPGDGICPRYARTSNCCFPYATAHLQEIEVLRRSVEPSQYTSAQLARFAREHNLARSVSRTGVCWDNTADESLWATLKVEFYDRYLWPIKAAAKLAVGGWIERVYNRRRRHSALGMISPVDFEERLNQTAQAA